MGVKIADAEKMALLEANNRLLADQVRLLIMQKNLTDLANQCAREQFDLGTLAQSIVTSYGLSGHEINGDYEIVPKS